MSHCRPSFLPPRAASWLCSHGICLHWFVFPTAYLLLSFVIHSFLSFSFCFFGAALHLPPHSLSLSRNKHLGSQCTRKHLKRLKKSRTDVSLVTVLHALPLLRQIIHLFCQHLLSTVHVVFTCFSL